MFFRTKNINKSLIFISLFPLFFSNNLFAKKNKDQVYVKYVHPRVYEIDLCDSEEQVFLGYSEESKLFESYIDFTRFVKNDMPQAGDQITFYYQGWGSKDAGTIFADVTDVSDISRTKSGEKIFVEKVIKKEQFQGQVSFVLKQDIEEKLYLCLWSSMENISGQIDQCNLNFKRLVQTTNTVKEAEAEKKALNKKIEIVEVTSDIINELSREEIEAAEEAARLEAEAAELEAARLAEIAAAEEAARLEAERIENERLEIQRQKEAMEKAIATAKSNNVTRYEKEYLNDYLVEDEPELPEDIESESQIIQNPDETDTFGRTLLMKAAKAGNDWQIRTLLKSGAKVNIKDKDGWTALMYAVRYQESMTCVDLLIDAGASIKVKNNYGSSALMIASCYNNNPEVLKKLLGFYTISDKEVLKSLIMLLSESQTSEYMQTSKLNVYLDLSVPLNTFYEGKTPLMYAAQFGNSTKIIKMLLDNNAVISIRSSEGKTAYDYASENKNLKHDDNYWALNKK